MSQNSSKKLIIIAGPTAVGKTSLSIRLAKHLGCDIISCDSRQFYREMNIGTAKPSDKELNEVKHHFINSLSIHDSYTVGDFEKDANLLIEKLFVTNDYVIMTGGSGLFIRAITEGLDHFPDVDESITRQLQIEFETEGLPYLVDRLKNLDPAYYEVVDRDNPRRIIRALSVIKTSGKPFSFFLQKKDIEKTYDIHYFIMQRDRQELYHRINLRVDQMIRNGLIEEAQSLLPYQDKRSLQTVGYQELFSYFNQEWTLDKAIDKIKQHTRNYAKRQLTWFKNVPNTIVLAADREEESLSIIIHKIKSNGNLV